MKATQKNDNCFLPNFCEVYIVFLGVVVTELLAFVFALIPLGFSDYDWNYLKNEFITDLAMISLFMQWVTLVSMALLCQLRHLISQLNNEVIIGLISYLCILIVTGLVSEFAWQMNNQTISMTSSWYNKHHQLFLWRNIAISAIISAITLRYFYIQYHWKKKTEALASAHAQALTARIRPHFLFNSMNTIASLIRFQPDKAEQAVVDFADLFRASLTSTKSYATFKEELNLCQQYLRIEVLRLGERLQTVWAIDEIPEDALLPPLCLQPLLENTIYHGIQPLSEGGTVKIIGQFDDQLIQIMIENPLAKIPSKSQGHQIAQQNIHQRLQLFYGRLAKLCIQRNVDTYCVTLYFPYVTRYDENSYR
jgi:two-component system, LytTR family, sensor histidine kinase AlgZ